jgi:LuxR family maltose regulon positive regulatory protein
MSLSHHSDPESFVTEFSGSERTVAAYLFDEVLANQSERVRRLLVRTSVLTRVNGALGDLLTGDPGAERELQSLADAGGFVIALDESRTWFRFHHLFADLLAVELRNTTPDEIPRLHALAAEWYADEGQILEAITHAEAAGAHEQAASLLIEHYFTLTLDGRRATARALLERLDTNAMGSFPEMATVMAAEQLVDGSLDQAAARLGLAERHAGKVPDNRKHRFAMAQMVTRISLARRLGDFRSVIDEVTAATSAEELHALSDGDVSMQGDIRALALMNLGIVETWSGRFQAGERHLAEASALAEQMRRPYLQVECQAHLASLVTWQSFTRAREAAVEVISLAERHGWGDDPVIAPALVTLGVSSMFAGEFDEADRNLSMAERTLRSELEPAVGFELRLARGALLQAQGRPAEALKILRDAEQLGLRLVEASPLSRQLRSSTLRAMIDVGETAAVRNILETMSELERAGGEVREIAASLALAEGDPEAALAEIEPVLVSGADVPHAEVVVRCQILEAVARDALNDMDGAERALERALDLAEEDTLIFSFIHIDSREVLQRHPRHRTAHGALIDRVLDAMSGNSPRPEAIQSTPLREKLSEAELRVLGFLPTNLSAAEIASEIYTSVHTVKTHMRHIYAKLDVHSRMEAVNRARGLGLLGRSVHRA